MSCVGPVYLVIFCYWVGPVPYLELFGVGPVEKNTLYIEILLMITHIENGKKNHFTSFNTSHLAA